MDAGVFRKLGHTRWEYTERANLMEMVPTGWLESPLEGLEAAQEGGRAMQMVQVARARVWGLPVVVVL